MAVGAHDTGERDGAEGVAADGGDARTRLAYRMRVLFERKIMADYRETFRGELGRTQAEVLEHLYEYGSARPVQIAEAIHVPKQHVSKIVGRLQEAGLVRSAPSELDGRAKVVELTERGRAYLDEHIARSSRLTQERVERLSAREQGELAEALATLVRLLEKM